MNGYLLPLSCPECAGLLEHVNAGKVNAGSECCAVARCVPCRREYGVFVQVRLMARSAA